jgi:hypothetical protein
MEKAKKEMRICKTNREIQKRVPVASLLQVEVPAWPDKILIPFLER